MLPQVLLKDQIKHQSFKIKDTLVVVGHIGPMIWDAVWPCGLRFSFCKVRGRQNSVSWQGHNFLSLWATEGHKDSERKKKGEI